MDGVVLVGVLAGCRSKKSTGKQPRWNCARAPRYSTGHMLHLFVILGCLFLLNWIIYPPSHCCTAARYPRSKQYAESLLSILPLLNTPPARRHHTTAALETSCYLPSFSWKVLISVPGAFSQRSPTSDFDTPYTFCLSSSHFYITL